ncbi:MAG: phosphodiesterase [Paracoccus sp. (in: a-proteobacteria)]|nr:phosphodiesterase [Paracoccus sp. (in: a-proteobacteria)]
MKIIQITDTHLLPPGAMLWGIDPADQLLRALDDITRHHADSDLLVITGDLCNDGDPAAYAMLRDMLEGLPCPVRLMLGNHDARPAFIDTFPDHPRDAAGFVQSVMDTDHGRLVFLDTHQAATIGGRYCAARLAWLKGALEGAGDMPVTVFMHHPPVADGLAHFTQIGLHDADAVRAVLAAHPGGIRHIIFGHIHVPLSGTSPEGWAFSSGQANAHRFITDLDDPTPFWTGGNPCYRILTLDETGFRAYGAEVGQPRIARSRFCEGP